MIAALTVCAVLALFAVAIISLIVDEVRYTQQARRAPTKQAMNRQRLARLHIVDRDPDDAA